MEQEGTEGGVRNVGGASVRRIRKAIGENNGAIEQQKRQRIETTIYLSAGQPVSRSAGQPVSRLLHSFAGTFLRMHFSACSVPPVALMLPNPLVFTANPYGGHHSRDNHQLLQGDLPK